MNEIDNLNEYTTSNDMSAGTVDIPIIEADDSIAPSDYDEYTSSISVASNVIDIPFSGGYTEPIKATLKSKELSSADISENCLAMLEALTEYTSSSEQVHSLGGK